MKKKLVHLEDAGHRNQMDVVVEKKKRKIYKESKNRKKILEQKKKHNA